VKEKSHVIPIAINAPHHVRERKTVRAPILSKHMLTTILTHIIHIIDMKVFSREINKNKGFYISIHD